jgi:hypothetical protein
LRPVDATRHEKDLMRAECGVKEGQATLGCDEQYAVLKVKRLLVVRSKLDFKIKNANNVKSEQ